MKIVLVLVLVLVLEKIKADNSAKRARLKTPMKQRKWFTANDG
jgi:hypothetical protein